MAATHVGHRQYVTALLCSGKTLFTEIGGLGNSLWAGSLLTPELVETLEDYSPEGVTPTLSLLLHCGFMILQGACGLQS